jgi:site-specific recombinase XerD
MSTQQRALFDFQKTDPIDRFLNHQNEIGASENTITAYTRVLAEYQAFLQERSMTVGTATAEDIGDWVETLRQNEFSDSTIATYFSYVHRFYTTLCDLQQCQKINTNPASVASDFVDETIESSPERRDISLNEMQQFASDIKHPLKRAVIGTFLKTGIRVGELCALNTSDVYIEGEEEFDNPRDELIEFASQTDLDCPGFLYMKEDRSEIEGADSVQVKRNNACITPIDEELENVLTGWVYMRPDPLTDDRPLFLSTGGEWGKRLTPAMARKIVEPLARDRGWYETGAGAESNVTPHYFRHFFTTHLRQRSGDTGLVEYLRGDSTENIIDDYTHAWGDEYQTQYLRNIYSVFQNRTFSKHELVSGRVIP